MDLAAAAWGYSEDEMATAAADLLHEYGHPIPERPKSWYRKLERQKPIRDALEEIRLASLQRRLFRYVFEQMLASIPDEEERAREAHYIWEEVAPLAVEMCESRRNPAG